MSVAAGSVGLQKNAKLPQRLLVLVRYCSLVLLTSQVYGHDVITTNITFDREIIRLFNAHCNSCHRDGGRSFSLETYQTARPWAKAIGEEVLQRRMPPWGAVKGFGDFRDDQGLTPEQLELIVGWEEGGAPEGEPKDIPQPGTSSAEPMFLPKTSTAIGVNGELRLPGSIELGALWPENVPNGSSFQMTAELPDGSVYPLIWLQNFQMTFDHAFILRKPLDLPAGTVIKGVPAAAKIDLIRAADVPPPPKRPPVKMQSVVVAR